MGRSLPAIRHDDGPAQWLADVLPRREAAMRHARQPEAAGAGQGRASCPRRCEVDERRVELPVRRMGTAAQREPQALSIEGAADAEVCLCGRHEGRTGSVDQARQECALHGYWRDVRRLFGAAGNLSLIHI